jgi:hypothetical protein
MRVRFQQRHDFDVVVSKLSIGRQDDPTARTYLRHPDPVLHILVKMVGHDLNPLSDGAQSTRDHLLAKAFVNEEYEVTRLF